MERSCIMKVHEIIQFGKGEISPHFLLESDSRKPTNLITFSLKREFKNLTTTTKSPYSISVYGDDVLEKAFKDSSFNIVRTINGVKQVKCGYFVWGYNTKTKANKLISQFWYPDSIPQINFGNSNYVYINPLDNLESDINSLMNVKLYDSVSFILLGGELDYFNGSKYVVNESNINQKKLIEISKERKIYPLEFLERLGTTMNLDRLHRKSMANVDSTTNKMLSYPMDYYALQFGKIDISKGKLVEEYFTYNNRLRNEGDWIFETLLDSDTLLDDSKPKYPFNNNYILSEKDKLLQKEGWDIIYGFDLITQFNVFNKTDDGEKIEFVEDKNGVKYKQSKIMCLYRYDDEENDQYHIHDAIFSEIKKADL